MTLKVIMKDGKIHRALDIEHLPGFVKLNCWNGEKRVPAGEVAEIRAFKSELLIKFWGLLLLFVVSFVVGLWMF